MVSSVRRTIKFTGGTIMPHGMLRALGVCLLTSGMAWGASPKPRISQPKPLPSATARSSERVSGQSDGNAGWAMVSDKEEVGAAVASDVSPDGAATLRRSQGTAQGLPARAVARTQTLAEGATLPSSSSVSAETYAPAPSYADEGSYASADGYVSQGSVGCGDYAGSGLLGYDGCGEGYGACGNGGCGPICGETYWAQVDYLYWWQRGSKLPPLITTTPNSNVPVSQAGVLTSAFQDSSTGSILLGNRDLETGPRSGGRVKFGRWFGGEQQAMVGGEFFSLQSENGEYRVNSDQVAVLARPFIDTANNNLPTSMITAYPGLATGNLSVLTETNVIGGGMFLRHGLTGFRDARLDMLWGYRFLRMDDYLRLNDSTTITGVGTGRPVAVGSTVDCFDEFDTKNEFHGGEVGLMLDIPVASRFRLNMLGKCAFGPVEQLVNIRGSTQVNSGNTSATFVGSLLTQESNIGLYRQRELAIVPEAAANLSMQITPRISGVIGYTFIYLSSVQRAADAVDLNVHSDLLTDTPVAGTPNPRFAFNDTDFWLQGINFGVDVRF